MNIYDKNAFCAAFILSFTARFSAAESEKIAIFIALIIILRGCFFVRFCFYRILKWILNNPLYGRTPHTYTQTVHNN